MFVLDGVRLTFDDLGKNVTPVIVAFVFSNNFFLRYTDSKVEPVKGETERLQVEWKEDREFFSKGFEDIRSDFAGLTISTSPAHFPIFYKKWNGGGRKLS